jgi:hypothetical protein
MAITACSHDNVVTCPQRESRTVCTLKTGSDELPAAAWARIVKGSIIFLLNLLLVFQTLL